MAAPMNALVRTYLRKWDKELDAISKTPEVVQNDVLESILQSPVFQFINGSLSIDQFRKTPISYYEDHEEKIVELMHRIDEYEEGVL